MKNFFGIILIFAMIYVMYIPLAYFKYTRAEEIEFSRLVLSKAMDYAGEAAIEACISVNDLELLYGDEDSMVLSPYNAAYAFASALCVSYDIPVTEHNIEDILLGIPVMVLAVNDGYYIAEQHLTTVGYELMWQPKKPYTIDKNPDIINSGIYYGISLNMDKIRVINKQTLSMATLNDYTGFSIDREAVYQHVNLCINRDVSDALTRHAAEWGKDTVQNFYLPVSPGTAGVRRIEKPSLIIVMQEIDIGGVKATNMSAINGMRIVDTSVIVGWTDVKGKKYYSSDKNLDAEAIYRIEINGVTFASKQEAAAAGYLPCH